MNSTRKTPLEPYEPPPVVSQSLILTVGFVLFLLAYIWPPLILLVAYLVSRLIPYSFRLSDDASVRRRDYHTFLQTADLPLSLRQVPDDVVLEERYWQNSRYVAPKREIHIALCAPRSVALTPFLPKVAWPCSQQSCSPKIKK
jgi:hypothetical protein